MGIDAKYIDHWTWNQYDSEYPMISLKSFTAMSELYIATTRNKVSKLELGSNGKSNLN